MWQVRVRADNRVGEGHWSDISVFRTIGFPMSLAPPALGTFVHSSSGSEFALTAVDATDPTDMDAMNSPYLVRLGVDGTATAAPFCHMSHAPYHYSCPKLIFAAADATAVAGGK